MCKLVQPIARGVKESLVPVHKGVASPPFPRAEAALVEDGVAPQETENV